MTQAEVLQTLVDSAREAVSQVQTGDAAERFDARALADKIDERVLSLLNREVVLPREHIDMLREASRNIRDAYAPSSSFGVQTRSSTAPLIQVLESALAILPGDDTTPGY